MFGFTNLPSKAQSHPLSAKRNHTLHTIFRMLAIMLSSSGSPQLGVQDLGPQGFLGEHEVLRVLAFV
jgi:hypothetical protein